MSKGPRYFSKSFFEGRVVRKNFAFTKALSPTLNSEEGSGSLVRGLLIAFLGLLNIDLEFAMEFLEVSD
jgi:hypothetical protein